MSKPKLNSNFFLRKMLMTTLPFWQVVGTSQGQMKKTDDKTRQSAKEKQGYAPKELFQANFSHLTLNVSLTFD